MIRREARLLVAELLSRVPSLFIVDGGDQHQLAVNRSVAGLSPQWQLEVVRTEEGAVVRDVAIDREASLSVAWLSRWFDPNPGLGG